MSLRESAGDSRRSRIAETMGAFTDQQEGGDALDGGLATEQHDLLAGGGELVRGNLVELALQMRVDIDKSIEARMGKLAQFRRNDRLGGERMFILHGDPQEIAREKKAGDLATAVGQQFGQAYSA